MITLNRALSQTRARACALVRTLCTTLTHGHAHQAHKKHSCRAARLSFHTKRKLRFGTFAFGFSAHLLEILFKKKKKLYEKTESSLDRTVPALLHAE